MLARFVSVGLLLSNVAIGGAGLMVTAPAQAWTSWGTPAVQSKRPMFRPLHRSDKRPQAGRWRPHPMAVDAVPRYRMPAAAKPSSGFAASARALTPVGQPAAPVGSARPDWASRSGHVQFRPHTRVLLAQRSASDDRWETFSRQAGNAQHQFRPLRRTPKPAYEQTQAGNPGISRMPPSTRYAMMPMPVYGAGWPRW